MKISLEDKKYIEKILYKKLYKWWLNLSRGNIIIIYKNGSNKLYKGNKWKEYGNNKDVIAIIFSSQSIDNLEEFIDYIIYKLSKKELIKFVSDDDLPKYLINNYKKFFKKCKLETNKDYTLKNRKINYGKLLKAYNKIIAKQKS